MSSVTGGPTNELIRSSTQYRLVQGSLNLGLTCLGVYTLFHLVMGLWSQIYFYEATLLSFLLLLLVWLKLVPFQRTKSPQDLDLIVVFLLIAVMMRNLASIVWLKQMDGISETILLLISCAFMFTSNRLFWSLSVNCVLLLLATHFFLDNELGPYDYASLLILLPFASWIARTVCETNFAKAFRQGQNEVRLANELAQVRSILHQAMATKEQLETRARHLESQISSILEIAPIRIRHLNRQGIPQTETGQIESAPLTIQGPDESHQDDLILSQIFAKAIQGQVQRLSKSIEGLGEVEIVFRPLFDNMGNVEKVAEVSFEKNESNPPETQLAQNQQNSRRMESLGPVGRWGCPRLQQLPAGDRAIL